MDKWRTVKIEEKTMRQTLVDFYNELQTVMILKIHNRKTKAQRRTIKKVCKPILDKYENILNGKQKEYLATLQAGNRELIYESVLKTEEAK